jgi:uncharacterized Zn finger protein
MLMSVETSPAPHQRSRFKIVCDSCGSLSIKAADPFHAEGATPVECARCGAVRGTLADVHKLALRRVDVCKYQSRENLQ